MSAIDDALKNIEEEHQCEILYACESGSRAWGFSSNDSDYDIRFIFKKKLSWYLKLNEPKDVIDCFLPGDLDLSGWDLRKALRLFSSSNASLFEWFDSPIIYYKNEDFYENMKEFLPNYFNPKKTMFHYWSLANKFQDQYLKDNVINIKKLFYILRAVTACKWIQINQTMPPTKFYNMVNQTILPSEIISKIDSLLEIKKLSGEKDMVTLEPEFDLWIRESIKESKLNADQYKFKKEINIQELNKYFEKLIL
ncbi:MAG: nucleotidyltransferase [Planctomycetota bacterium]|nr:MAG: nucleotidyltransferase [Planctomycetota bacterium]